ARVVLDGAPGDVLSRHGCPRVHAGLAREQLDQVRPGAKGVRRAVHGFELRLVPLLPTHLSMPEIGEQLHLSRHTVKSEVISLYRKLGVSSRSEAVARISELKLQA
ncbi:MAG TPA: LuxR C-terminal-related transcriptional regulator, partial [Nocardioides sp.]|nr:LuxR C-terminal-related transcriptional regulator [Nocardioides sp.]